MQVISVTPTLDTNIYADNDVLFNGAAVADFGGAGKARKLVSVVIHDQSDQAQDFDLFFSSGDITLGTINEAVSAADAVAGQIVGWVSIVSADYNDLIEGQVAMKTGLGLVLQPIDTLYVAGVLRSGTPTYAAGGMVIKLGFEDIPR